MHAVQHLHHDFRVASGSAPARIVIPPLHPEVLARRGKLPPPAHALPPTTVVLQQLYTRGCTEVVDVPMKDIVHMPKGGLHITRLVICSHYDPTRPHDSCPNGSRCKYVHTTHPQVVTKEQVSTGAELASDAQRHKVHINYAWRSAEDVTYERFPGGHSLFVAPPHGAGTPDVMDSAFALKTKALDTCDYSHLVHCAHYYLNRTCNLGPECRFIHAVYIDPKAKANQRAPAPAKTQPRGVTVAMPPHCHASTAAPHMSPDFKGRGCLDDPLAACEVASDDSATEASVRASSPRGSWRGTASSDRSSSSGDASNVTRRSCARFRFDPYCEAGRVCVLPCIA